MMLTPNTPIKGPRHILVRACWTICHGSRVLGQPNYSNWMVVAKSKRVVPRRSKSLVQWCRNKRRNQVANSTSNSYGMYPTSRFYRFIY